jgi:adenylosuccinate synthase
MHLIQINGKTTDQVPFDNNAAIEPVYTELPGWQEDITGIREYNALPVNLRNYV